MFPELGDTLGEIPIAKLDTPVEQPFDLANGTELSFGLSKADEQEAMMRRLSALDWLPCTDAVWERAHAASECSVS